MDPSAAVETGGSRKDLDNVGYTSFFWAPQMCVPSATLGLRRIGPRMVIFLLAAFGCAGVLLSVLAFQTTDMAGRLFQYRPGGTNHFSERPLILYAYHETPNARRNALFFIHHGLHATADFIFILNGPTNITSELPQDAPNIRFIQRNNTCYDLGAHGEVLSANDDELIKKYNKFILMNASIRGPFLPTWSRECWSDVYLARITDMVKLIGMTFNCVPVHGRRHLQSMLYATDRVGLRAIMPVLRNCPDGWLNAVKMESNVTQTLHAAGYEVGATMTSFASTPDYPTTCTHGDVLINKGYYGNDIHPYEMVFQKANRKKFGQGVLETLTNWTDAAGYSSWEVCGRDPRTITGWGGWGRWGS
ncbi:hypothetical protein DRE_00406 [Drechslerella stenobrocha 248]|uniref:Uncharacterized protein n=1 Tax=Drechslerella stenobrocha 248 TaxID=1043628 RepID=W7I5H7_9PEZI|nr:hypothetical protein DRE_00406 [Drechslerella stenobrocha 248]